MYQISIFIKQDQEKKHIGLLDALSFERVLFI